MSEQARHKPLPRLVDPRKLATKAVSLERRVEPSELSRLAEVVHGVRSVDVSLSFKRDEHYRCEIQGQVSAQLELQCQRCLEPVGWFVESAIHWVVVPDDDRASALPSSVDALILGADEDDIDLVALIEDEILLDLPVIARHDYDCIDPGALNFGDQSEPEVADSPFSVLADLKPKPR